MKPVTKHSRIRDLKEETVKIHKETKKTANKTSLEARKLLKILEENHISIQIYKAIGGHSGH